MAIENALRPPKIEWAQDYADAWHELTNGAHDIRHTLDHAYVLWDEHKGRSAAEVAREEWEAGQS